jgi:site-specific DNA-methyltransferase (adenine-specific)
MSDKDGTETSEFGVSERVNHDSSKFYNSDLYENYEVPDRDDIDYIENSIKEEYLNSVIHGDSRNMDEIPDESIHLMITSPPYNAEKEYDEDWNLREYRELLKNVFSEVYDKLVWGGRAIVNVANLGRNPYIPLHTYIIKDMLELGYLMRGEVIWNKEASAGASVAWGSWQSASNPTLRDIHEYILIFSKGPFGRATDKEDSIKKEEFLEYTKSVWKMQTASASEVGHPAPFPKELPYRIIQLYSFKNDVVLDPFLGSGTTGIVARNNQRNYVGYDIEEEYVKLAQDRIKEERNVTR